MDNKKNRILAIIPARGGSKGVPGKNVKEFCGKPLIQYAVDCAIDVNEVDKIIVDSDGQEILNQVNDNNDTRVSKILRPPHLGEDNSSIVDVILHLLNKQNEIYDLIILLQPTSPIRSPQDIAKIIALFNKDKDVEGVISVIPMDDMHPARMYNIDENKNLVSLVKDDETKHRQDLKSVYYRNGCFYTIRTEAFLEQKTFMPSHKKAYVMNPEHLLNIDSPRDILLAEVMIKAWLNNQL
jgi:N-acylneuraminate cytidylyltransferase